jgi:hypothetical protein
MLIGVRFVDSLYALYRDPMRLSDMIRPDTCQAGVERLVFSSAYNLNSCLFLMSTTPFLMPFSTLFRQLFFNCISLCFRFFLFHSLYPNCLWDEKQIRRWMGDGKLAPRLQGSENRSSVTDVECPICFLHYARMNVTKCCQANICTECFLQVRKPPHYKPPHTGSSSSGQGNNCSSSSICPFCNAPKISITVAAVPTASVIQARQAEEQRVLEAKFRARNESEKASHERQQQQKQEQAIMDASNNSNSSSTFGTSLDQNERVALWRARSSSLSESNNSATGDSPSHVIREQQNQSFSRQPQPYASSQHGNNNNTTASSNLRHHLLLDQTPSEEEIAACLAMTAAERSALEAEMRAQHQHPLTRRIQQEEAERRLQNQLNYYHQRQQEQQQQRQRALQQLQQYNSYSGSGGESGRPRAYLTLNGPPDAGRLGNNASTGGGASAVSGSTSSGGGRDWNRIVSAFEQGGRNGGAVQSLDDLVVLEAAIMLSMEEEARRQQGRQQSRPSRQRRGGASGEVNDNDDEGSGSSQDEQSIPAALFDAARHASQGFPLARARVAAAAAARGVRGGDDDDDDDDDSDDDNDESHEVGRFLRSLRGTSGRRLGGFGAPPSAQLDAASLIMRGMSEEDQIALAIAASLQDQQGNDTENSATSSVYTSAASATEESAATQAVSISGRNDPSNASGAAFTSTAEPTGSTANTATDGTAATGNATAAVPPSPLTNTASSSCSSSQESTLVAQTGLSLSASKLNVRGVASGAAADDSATLTTSATTETTSSVDSNEEAMKMPPTTAASQNR